MASYGSIILSVSMYLYSYWLILSSVYTLTHNSSNNWNLILRRQYETIEWHIDKNLYHVFLSGSKRREKVMKESREFIEFDLERE